MRTLRELARSYLTIVKDLARVMNRLKAIYRSWAIPCAGRDVYYRRHRSEWLGKIVEAGVRRRAISRVKGVKQLGTRSGNWLSLEQSSDVLSHARGDRMRQKRDHAMLAILFGCGLRRSELATMSQPRTRMPLVST